MQLQLVSVVVPCYNCEGFVERCVRSVEAQSHAEWELILVDNNSTDGTLEILKKLEAERPDRIRVLVEPRQGACAARNTGLKHARGRWIQFLDADDVLLPEKFTKQLKLLDDEVCFVAGDYICKTAKAITVTRSRSDPFSGLLTSNLGITSANLFNRRYLDAIGGWSEALSSSQEYDLMFRLMKLNARVAVDRELHTVVHKTPGSIMTHKDMKNERTKNSLNLRLQIRNFLIATNQFHLSRRYWFSVFVGGLTSASPSGAQEPVEFNRAFYASYRLATSFSRPWRRLRWRRYGGRENARSRRIVAMNPSSRILPFLYFAPIGPGARVLILADAPGCRAGDFSIPEAAVRIAVPGKSDTPSDVLFFDSRGEDPDLTPGRAVHLLKSQGSLIICDRRRDKLSAAISAPRRMLGVGPGELLGRRASWEFLVEPHLDKPRFLVLPGLRSEVPTTSDEPVWHRIARKLGLVYALPRDIVKVYTTPGSQQEPVLKALSDAIGSPVLPGDVRSIYVSATELMIVRADTPRGSIYARFPFTDRARDRVRNSCELQAWVRSCGSSLPPEQLALDLDGPFPYAVEMACQGRTLTGRATAVASSPAIRAIARIHVASASSPAEELDEKLFAHFVESRLQLIEAKLGAGRMDAIRQRLSDWLLGRKLLLSVCHGDFKLENCLFDRGAVSGIIDWDMGSRQELSVLDVAHFYARLSRKRSLAEMAQDTSNFCSAYEEYFEMTQASVIPPRELLLLWHVDQVAKELLHGNHSERWMEKHVPW